MKTFLFKSVVCILIITLSLSLIACGSKLKGTYEKVDNDYSTTVKKLYFQGNRVTVTDMGFHVECDYKIEDGTIYINGTSNILGTEMDVSYEYEIEIAGSSIFLDGKEYKKQ